MKLDSTIRRRFQELTDKAKEVESKKTGEYLTTSGRTLWSVPRAPVIAWGTSVISLLQQVFGPSAVHTHHFQTAFNEYRGDLPSFEVLTSLLAAAREDYEGGYVFSIQGLVRAEVLTDSLEQADELLRKGYKDPACVLIGVSLESAVKHLATKHSVEHAKLDRMNTELSRLGVYNMAKQKQVTAWADLRNRAAHGDWAAYAATDVQAMLAGVQQFVADFL